MHRLTFGTVTIQAKGFYYVGHLVDEAGQDERILQQRRHYVYRLNPTLLPLFGRTQYTLNEWQARLQLGKNGIAKWLQLWIESHAEQYPTSVEVIKQRSGSVRSSKKNFYRYLKEAFFALRAAGIITAWEIDPNGIVHISRTPSASQAKHIRKRGRPRLNGT